MARVRYGAAVALSLLAAAAGAGCGGSGGERSAAPPARWSLEVDLTYTLPDSLALTSVPDLAVAADGRAYALAGRLYRVLAFGGDGELLGSVGREGEGPGEFRDPRRVGLDRDTLWVADAGSGRVLLFHRSELSPLATLEPPASVGAEMGRRAPLGLFPGGDPLYMTYRESGGVESARGFDARYLRLTGPGSSAPGIDTVLRHRTRCESLPLRFGDDGAAFLDNHLCDDEVVAGDGSHGRLVVVERPFPAGDTVSTYRVRAVDGSGRGEALWTASIPFRSVRMTEALWDHWMADVDGQITQLVERIQAFPSKRAAREALQDAVAAVPDHLPPVPLTNAGPLGRPEAFVASNGWVWIQRWTAVSELGGDYREWDVLDAEGRWRARAVAPEPVTLHDATGTHAWGVRRDEVGVPRVVRLRIVR